MATPLKAMEAYDAGREDRDLALQIVNGLLAHDKIAATQTVTVMAALIGAMAEHRHVKGELS